MGNTSYNFSDRALRTTTYASKSVTDNFEQQKKREIHDSMNPKGITFRECRDSEAHPLAFPVIYNLDVTGSMGHIPQQILVEGLPTFMSNLVQRGVNDAAVLFTCIGDHEADTYPFQVGQFESGDKELDMWLTRSYLEGGGGGNRGESYLLAWYFAAFHTVSDAWEKRKQKGFLFTIGDEPCLENLPKNAIEEIFGNKQAKSYTAAELLEEARKTYHVFHINVLHSSSATYAGDSWKRLIGQGLIQVKDYTKIPETIAKLILDNMETPSTVRTETVTNTNTDSKPSSETEIYL